MSEITQEAEKRTGLSFGDALERMKRGFHVTRLAWETPPMKRYVFKFTYYSEGKQDHTFSMAVETRLGEDNCLVKNWIPNMEDIFAEDWELYGAEDTSGYILTEEAPAEATLPGLPIVPVYRKESADFFVNINTLTPNVVELAGQEILTSALQFGKKLDLLGISFVDALINTGIQDCTDCIDPAVSLANIYANVNGAVVKVSLLDQALNVFTPSVASNYRDQVLNFDGIQDFGDAKAYVKITGTVNLQFGTIEVNGEIVQVRNEHWQNNKVELLGYDIQAYRVNYNRRPR